MSPKEQEMFEQLLSACASIVRNWEHGDLAYAARLCDAAVQDAAEFRAQQAGLTVFAEPPVGMKAEPLTLVLARRPDKSIREYVRRRFRHLAMEVFVGCPHSVHFEDECQDCEGPLQSGHCPNVNCPSHATKEERL
jgi:hypothetical protein